MERRPRRMDSGGGVVVVSSGAVGRRATSDFPAPAMDGRTAGKHLGGSGRRNAGASHGRLRAVERLAPERRLQRVAGSLPWALICVILIGGGLLGSGAMDQVLGFGGAAFFALVAFRAARLRLLLGDDIVVVGWLGSRHVPWSEVEKFVVTKKGLAIRMRGGLEEQVPAFSMGGWVLPSMRASMQADLDRVCGKAEEYRRSRRGKK